MKLESLDPNLNNEIISGKKNLKNFEGYKYGTLSNKKVPAGIIDAFDVYGNDYDCLGIETMILRENGNK